MDNKQRKELFEYFHEEHGILLLDSEIDEIESIVIGSKTLIKEQNAEIDLNQAEELAMKTDYAVFAVEEKGNEINKADAGAFFLEGYGFAVKLKRNGIL